jgi:Phosphotransferase enzyme family
MPRPAPIHRAARFPHDPPPVQSWCRAATATRAVSAIAESVVATARSRGCSRTPIVAPRSSFASETTATILLALSPPADELRAVFGFDDGSVEMEPLGRGVPAATAGVWLVRAGGAAAVLKVVHENPAGHSRWPAVADSEHPYYWRREVCAYESGFLERLPGGVQAPRCRGCFERADGSVALWLEALPATTWTIDGYGRAARAMGRMQAALAAALPCERWLSRRWLRAYLDLRLELTGPRSEEQEAMLRAVEAGPQTFCHLDFYPENLFGDGEESILVDWAYCGIGALGEDPGNFVPDTLLDGFVPAEQADALERAVWEGYRAGLADAGWGGDERAVRFAFCATPWLKYQWVPPALGSWTLDDATQARWRATLPLIERLGEEARGLVPFART